MKRDNCFDFLRFVFALNVVLGHLTVIALIPALQDYHYLFNTALSVTGFFVISGFLIAQSYERSSSVRSYFEKRARRLLPAYLLVIISCALGLAALSDLPVQAYFSSADFWEYLGANLSFMNFIHPSLPGVFNSPLILDNTVNPSLWTLKVEIGFYLVIPLLMLWLRKSKKPWVALVIIYALAVLYRKGMLLLGDYTSQHTFVFLARQLPWAMSYFAVGMAGYLYKDYFLRYKNHMILPAIIVFLIEYHFGWDVFSPLAWGIIVLWCAYSLSALNNFAKYGDISYGIYIYHGPVIKILLTIGCFELLGTVAASALYILLVLLIGFLSWQLLEKRILKRK